MIPIYLDFESFWSTTHTLSKMGAIEYVMHPDTEIQSCAIKIGSGPTRVVFGEDKLQALFNKIDWSDKIVVAHNNSEFDALISAWRFGIKPKMWGCTLAMARPIYSKTSGLSLAKVAAAVCPELGVKGSLEATNTKGKKLCDFTPAEIEAMKIYNVQDTELCAGIFNKLASFTGTAELRLIDATIRMLVEPAFVLDTPLLETTLAAEKIRKQANLVALADKLAIWPFGTPEERAEAVTTELASAPKFSALLKGLGVDVPMKPSPSDPAKMIPALAKTDQEFLDLQDHENEMVSMAAAARLGVKSTLLETRIEKFLKAGSYCGGLLPVPLRYYGADTTGRWSGWAYNPQNLPRVSGKASDALRNSLRAPKGYKVVVADLSGIELRVNHFLWKEPGSMKLFQDSPGKADLYKDFASSMYDKDAADVTKDERMVGKVSHLGLGFGAGATTFQKVAKLMAGIDLNEGESQSVVSKWREEYSRIVTGWKTCHKALDYIASGEKFFIDPWSMCFTSPEGIVTPKGVIRYPNLRKEKGEDGQKDEWVYGEGRNKSRIYAGKIDENLVQHLARNVLADNLLEIQRQIGFLPVHTVHDELIYIVPEAIAEDVLGKVQSVMRTPPKWWPELITWSEGDVGDTYGECK